MFHQQEEKDRETPKDSLDDLFPNDEEEHGQGSKKKSIQQSFYLLIKNLNAVGWIIRSHRCPISLLTVHVSPVDSLLPAIKHSLKRPHNVVVP